MFYSLKYDDIMKELFQNNIVLTHFISDVLGLPLKDIRSLRLLNTFLRRRFRNQKLGILDVLVELNDRTKVNIELQVKIFRYWDRRQIFYLAKLYTADLQIGEDYSKLRRCVGISILDFNLTDRKEYHSVYRLKDQNGYDFSDTLEIHVIELQKMLTGQEAVDDWIRLFNAKTEEDLSMIKTGNLGIQEAIRELRRMRMDHPIRALYESYQKQKRDELAWKNYVREEIREEVIAEVIAEVTAEVSEKVTKEVTEKVTKEVTEKVTKEVTAEATTGILLEMLRAGESDEKIKQYGKLTDEQLNELKQHIHNK